MSWAASIFWTIFISIMTLTAAAFFLIILPVHREQKREKAETAETQEILYEADDEEWSAI